LAVHIAPEQVAALYQDASIEVRISGTGVSPVQAHTNDKLPV